VEDGFYSETNTEFKRFYDTPKGLSRKPIANAMSTWEYEEDRNVINRDH